MVKLIGGMTLLLSLNLHAADLFDVLKQAQGKNISIGDTGSIPKDFPNINDPAVQKQIQEQYALQNGANPPQAGKGGASRPSVQNNNQFSVRDEAFAELLNKRFPLTPEQTKQLHLEYVKNMEAINSSATVPPQPVSSTMHVDLSPGAGLPVIRLSPGFVSSLVFVDSTGKPWPVADYSLGNPTDFNIQWDSKTNALFVQNLKDRVTGNLAIRLANLETPIMLSLVTGQREIDYRVDLQVPGRGPNALIPIMDNTVAPATNSLLLSLLDGIPPVGSIEVGVSDGHGKAWLFNNRLFFRTKLMLLSPAWTATVSSGDGTRVYELVQTPLLIASKDGRTINILLSGL
jgi:intracellular multiplication protein IcmK